MSSSAKFAIPTGASDGDTLVYNAALNKWELAPASSVAVADGSVTTAKLASSAVTGAKIADNTITTSKLAGTGARDASTFYRGDGVFAAAPAANFDQVGAALASTIFAGRAVGDAQHRIEVQADGRIKLGDGTVAPTGPTNLYYADSTTLATDGQLRVGQRVFLGTTNASPSIIAGFGNPNGVYSGYVGSIYLQKDGASGTSAWFKESGNGTDTGWIARGTGGSGGGGSAPAYQSVAYSSAITPNPSLGEVVAVGTLTGALTVNNPSTNTPGMALEFHFQQDPSGGHPVSYANYFEPSAPVDTTPGARTFQRFRCLTATLWVEI